ncbi:uncharacterized protein B0I36DRAFT_351122 [Microdochium trichocladiopsis]|uniref:Uncharacterized protein n=1 Tax=Microdochium trichocladiopsis TaxID=1682393 RepID=A0A9P9BRT5_9PEZI|nr:uncharacterized protein B0I36DRAFT_351122 [Microdochium trichocladiopsis]KAH7027610.1 hypothetical protein B0I36DRAFT_351122 [Microdochium trichocladiopsis]
MVCDVLGLCLALYVKAYAETLKLSGPRFLYQPPIDAIKHTGPYVIAGSLRPNDVAHVTATVGLLKIGSAEGIRHSTALEVGSVCVGGLELEVGMVTTTGFDKV